MKARKSETNKEKKVTNIIKYRKWIIIGTFLVIIVFGIVGGYVSTYFARKVTPFETLQVSETKASNINAFTFDFYCGEYNEPDENNAKTTMKFYATISNAKENYTITAVKYKVALGNESWTKRYIEASSTTTIASTYTSQSAKTTAKLNSITGYTYTYPCRTMLFIKTKTPDAFVYLEWTENKDGTQTTTTYKKYMTYSYNEYFRTGTTIIG